MEHVEVLRDLSEVCRAAIKAGDWKVDGACDPDSLLRHADAAIASLSAPQPPAEAQAQGVGEVEPDGYTSCGEFLWACDCDERQQREWIPVYLAPPSAPVGAAEAQPCGCDEATCTAPWEPGCGLGKSEQHAVVQAQPVMAYVEHHADKVSSLVLTCEAVGLGLGKHALYAAPPSAPVGVEGLSASLRDARERMIAALGSRFGEAFDGDFDVMRDAADALAQQPAPVAPVGVEGAPIRYFAYDSDCGDYNEFDTLPEAIRAAQEALDYAGDDGWPPGGPSIYYGAVLGEAREVEGSRRPAGPNDHPDADFIVEYELTGSDALAQQPASDPLEEWANRPLNFTATVGKFEDDAVVQQPAAVDEAMVTDEMMERAESAWDVTTNGYGRFITGNNWRECLRAALTAALAAQPGGSDNDR